MGIVPRREKVLPGPPCSRLSMFKAVVDLACEARILLCLDILGVSSKNWSALARRFFLAVNKN